MIPDNGMSLKSFEQGDNEVWFAFQKPIPTVMHILHVEDGMKEKEWEKAGDKQSLKSEKQKQSVFIRQFLCHCWTLLELCPNWHECAMFESM